MKTHFEYQKNIFFFEFFILQAYTLILHLNVGLKKVNVYIYIFIVHLKSLKKISLTTVHAIFFYLLSTVLQ